MPRLFLGFFLGMTYEVWKIRPARAMQCRPYGVVTASGVKESRLDVKRKVGVPSISALSRYISHIPRRQR